MGQQSLFDSGTATVEPPKRPDIDWYNETAKRCHGKPTGWRWYSLDSHDKPPDFFLCGGAVPLGFKKSGRPKWPPVKDCDLIWMKFSDVDETRRLWEIETGKCCKCLGTGQMNIGWSAAHGSEYGDCNKCNATGKASEATV